MLAASLRSAGTDCRAPVQTRNMYGKPIHRFVSTTANFAVVALPNQLTSNPVSSLINPKSRL